VTVSTRTQRLRRSIALVAYSLVVPLALLVSPATATAGGATAITTGSKQMSAGACLQPPQGVNLMQLSNAQLRMYDFPTHDVLEANPAHWAAVLSHARHHVCGSKPNPRHLQMPDCPQPGSICHSPVWAGNEASEWPVQRGVYREAEVIAAVPTIQTYDSTAQVAIWAGLGGDGNITTPAVLVQDGVDSWVSNGTQYNFAWWEVVPGFDAQIVNLTVNTGNSIDAYTSSNFNNDGYDLFSIYNDATDTYYACSLNTTGGTNNNDCLLSGQHGNTQWNSDSASGECIVERPSVNGNPVPLAQFHDAGQPTNTLLIGDCWIGEQAIGQKNHHDDKMVDSNGQVIAACGAIFNNGLSFPVTWYHET
jgi:hypothetical protein